MASRLSSSFAYQFINIHQRAKTGLYAAPDTATGKFTVNAWVNDLAGGTVSTMGNTTCTEGQTLTYTITPTAGYRIAKVTVDGVDVGAVTGYTFKDINRNHGIGAYFYCRNYDCGVVFG